MRKKLLPPEENVSESKQQTEQKAKKMAADGKDRAMMWTVVIILGVVILAVALMLLIQLVGNGHEEDWNSAHFYDVDNYPELSAEGIKGAINEAYYTQNGALCVKLRFSNGVDAEHFVTSLEVKVSNEDEEVIATGYTADIPDDYSVPAMGYNTFTFYISKKFVKIPDDDLNKLTYEITVQGEVDSDALAAATTTTTGGDAATTTTTTVE